MRVTTLLAATSLLLAPHAGRGQTLVDPFAGVQPRPDLARLVDSADRAHAGLAPLEAAGVRAARLVGESFDTWVAERVVGGRRLVFVRGWTGGGTGFRQIGTLVFAPAGRDSVRRVWWGVADEVVDLGSFDGRRTPHWRIHGCLYVYGGSLVYVRSRPAPAQRAGDPPPVPGNGTYRWSERGGRFVRSGPAPAAAWPRCRRARDLTEP